VVLHHAWKMALPVMVAAIAAACLSGCPSGPDEAEVTVIPEDVAPPPEADPEAMPGRPAEEDVSTEPTEPETPEPAAEPAAAQAQAEPEPEPEPEPTSAPAPEESPAPSPPASPAPAAQAPSAAEAPPPVPEQPPAEAAPAPAEEPRGTVVVGRITVASHVPDPSEVPYTECLTFVKYAVEEVESGEYGEGELLAAFWGMRDSRLEPAARFTPGQRHRLTIEPLSEHPDLSRVMQADDTNEYSLTPYWVVGRSGI